MQSSEMLFPNCGEKPLIITNYYNCYSNIKIVSQLYT